MRLDNPNDTLRKAKQYFPTFISSLLSSLLRDQVDILSEVQIPRAPAALLLLHICSIFADSQLISHLSALAVKRFASPQGNNLYCLHSQENSSFLPTRPYSVHKYPLSKLSPRQIYPPPQHRNLFCQLTGRQEMKLSHAEFSPKHNHVSHPCSVPGIKFKIERSPAPRRTHDVWHGRKTHVHRIAAGGFDTYTEQQGDTGKPPWLVLFSLSFCKHSSAVTDIQ